MTREEAIKIVRGIPTANPRGDEFLVDRLIALVLLPKDEPAADALPDSADAEHILEVIQEALRPMGQFNYIAAAERVFDQLLGAAAWR